jgi:rubrerythrin
VKQILQDLKTIADSEAVIAPAVLRLAVKELEEAQAENSHLKLLLSEVVRNLESANEIIRYECYEMDDDCDECARLIARAKSSLNPSATAPKGGGGT